MCSLCDLARQITHHGMTLDNALCCFSYFEMPTLHAPGLKSEEIAVYGIITVLFKNLS